MKKHTKSKLALFYFILFYIRITQISNLINDFSMSIDVCIYIYIYIYIYIHIYNMDHVHHIK